MPVEFERPKSSKRTPCCTHADPGETAGMSSVILLRFLSRMGRSRGPRAVVAIEALMPVQARGPRGCSRRSDSGPGFG